MEFTTIFGVKYYFMASETESVKLLKSEVDKIRKYVAASKHTIGGYISLLIEKDMARKSKTKKQ